MKARTRTLLKKQSRMWTPFIDIPITDDERTRMPFLKHCSVRRVNSRYECLLFNCGTKIGGVVQLNVRAHLHDAVISYADLMQVKSDLFGDEAQAVEIYPVPANNWPGNAPVRVLWILPSGYDLGFGLEKNNAWGAPAE